MAKKFQTVRRKARFQVGGYSPDHMESVGREVRDSIEQRVLKAEDVYDAPAPPLKNGTKGRGYPFYKNRKAPPAIRNWRFTGRTLRSMRVLSVAQNRATIGFTDPEANRRAFWNNKRARQFGMSPRNREVLNRSIRRVRFVSAVKAA